MTTGAKRSLFISRLHTGPQALAIASTVPKSDYFGGVQPDLHPLIELCGIEAMAACRLRWC